MPALLPRVGNVTLLEPRLAQYVDPVLDVHRLLLDRKSVVRALLALVVVEKGRLDGIRRKTGFERRDDIRDVLELAIEGPFAGHLEIVDVRVGNIGRRSGIERRNG